MARYPLVTLAVTALLGLAASELAGFLPVVAALLLLGAGLLGRPGDSRGHALYALLLLATLYGQYRYWNVAEDDIGHFAGATVRLTATVAELPHEDGPRSVFLARAERVAPAGGTDPAEGVPVSGTVRVSRYRPDGAALLTHGDRFTANVALRPITSLRNPGGFDYAAFMWRQGVRVRAAIPRRTPVAVEAAAGGPLTALHRWRDGMRRAARRALPPDAAAVLTALAAGDARGVPREVRDRFQAAGVAHLLAVSGTHLGLVAGVVFLLVRWGTVLVPVRLLRTTTARVTLRQVASGFALAAVTAYALLAGAHTPTLRALVMVWLVVAALASGRRSHSLTALALAALGILAWDPRAAGEASFQLSFAAVLAIVLVLARLPPPEGPDGGPPSRAARLRHGALSAVLMTVAAGLATAPLAAWHFGYVSWVGFLANLVLVPFTGFVVLPLAVGAAVAAPALGGLPLAGLLKGVLAAFLALVGWFAALPGAGTAVPAPPLALLAGTYGVALVLLLAPGAAARRAVALGAAVLVSLWVLYQHPSPPKGALRVAFLDVGQGDAAVAVGPEGDALVIDGGTRVGTFDAGRFAVAPYLRTLGARPVALLSTHPELDHAGGLIHLVGAVGPRAFYTNGVRRHDVAFAADLDRALADAGLPATVLAPGDPFAPVRGVDAEVLGPAVLPPGNDRRAYNNGSLVVRLGLGAHRILFTGDIEATAEAALAASGGDLAATVLKVPHHGSATSSTAAFLARVRPRVAVISVGAFNRFHHPSPAVVDAYRDLGADVRTTAGDGAVLVETDGRRLRVATWARLAPARVPPWATDPAAAERLNLVRLARPDRLWRSVAADPAPGP